MFKTKKGRSPVTNYIEFVGIVRFGPYAATGMITENSQVCVWACTRRPK